MDRNYMNYVSDACMNGMTSQEVQTLFTNIYNKSNTKRGKKVLKLFAQGIGKAKKDVLNNSKVVSHQYIKQQY